MGSVKDLEVIKKPTAESLGVGRFHFSDRYSVFDWGEMPDNIAAKGAALCLMGAYCFEQLDKKGIKSHYRGLMGTNGRAVKIKELSQPSSIMEICLVNVYNPKTTVKDGKLVHDYSMYTPDLKNCLIPLEIIYRNGLPQGSSIFKRLEQGEISLNDLGLDRYPAPGEQLIKPIFDVSTKLEETDRYLTWQEAQKIACLSKEELEKIKSVLLKVDEVITEMALKAGLRNEDGKIELAFDDNRELMIVDVVGTLDECRFTYEGLPVSKEIARQFYKKTSWYTDLEQAKKEAEAKGIMGWQSLCCSQPPKLDPKLKAIISEMYMAAANEMTGHKLFNAQLLSQVIADYKSYVKE